MTSYFPISLSSGNLGQRHHCLNKLVAEAYSNNAFQDVERIPEQSPLDRLFKIDLASKHKQVDYIIQNLKHDDMLYVSRALKATWLLDPEYQDIINPKHLEDVLFPEMITPAVTKMIHWLYINLHDAGRRYHFYQHYKEKNIDLALKFLARCSNGDLLKEFPKTLVNLSPHYLKIFCEQCPVVAKIHFNALSVEKTVMLRYQNNIQAYLDSIKSTLKIDPDMYLDIIEKHHHNYIKKLSPIATKYIIRNRKNRFVAKPELYTAWILHIPTLAEQLSEEESEKLIITLARAKFLNDWFTYKEVEPLVKRLSLDRRAAFKKRIFVNKDVGDLVEDWPYQIPSMTPECFEEISYHAFDDPEDTPHIFDFSKKVTKRMIKKKKGCIEAGYGIITEMREKTELSRLFDEFRFVGFEGTYCELGRRLGAAGSAESRRSMFLVLVSKAGGREASVAKLLQLMERHINEPANLRAAIVRSLVKRACVWRLSDDAWASLLKFGHDLGLDGAPAEADCHEGMLAVVVRQLLSQGELGPDLRAAYLDNFSDLSEYSFLSKEKALVITSLTHLLLNAAEKSEPDEAARYLDRLIDVLKAHRIPIERKSLLVLAVKHLAVRHADAARPILYQLYDVRVARKELFLENLEFRRDDASYMNALRHDPEVLKSERLVEKLSEDKIPLQGLMRKLAIYFAESEGLATRMLNAIKQRIETSPELIFSRPLTSLLGQNLWSYIQYLDTAKDDAMKKRLSVALRTCSHLARPKLNIDEIKMPQIGANAITTRVRVCRKVDVQKYINKLVNWRKTVKTALLLAERNGTEAVALTIAAKVRPIAAIKAALRYFRRYNDRADAAVWDLIKTLILTLNLKNQQQLTRTLICVESIPTTFRADYCVTLYAALSKVSINHAVIFLYRDVENLLPDMKTEAVEDILSTMLLQNEECINSIVYPSFFVKYLLLSKSEEEQRKKLDTIGQRFLDRVIFLIQNLDKSEYIRYKYLSSILERLKYSKVFIDTQYVSCEPVFERVLAWMQKNFALEEFFKRYVEIHLTMLYHRAIRHSITVEPEIFQCPKLKMNAGVVTVGTSFGRLIAREVSELTLKYFTSITQLYENVLKEYLLDYFLVGPSVDRLRESIMNGILEENICVASRLVIDILKDARSFVSDTASKEIINTLKCKDTETQFFVYAELY